jgi:hypothetical protein
MKNLDDIRDFIDSDEAREFPSPFYVHASPCESCGEPTFQGRIWNQEHELWVAVDCSCNTPDLPACPDLIPLLAQVDTVSEVCQVIRQHRMTCSVCGPVKLPPKREAGKETPAIRKEAA